MTRIQQQIEQHRQGEACIEICDSTGRPLAGISVWAEQESHEFTFGCVEPDLRSLSADDRERCRARMAELFNRVDTADRSVDAGTSRVSVPAAANLGQFRAELDRHSGAIEIWLDGSSIGLTGEIDAAAERRAAERAAELYSLGFAHPAVAGIIWDRFSGDSGLLRPDFAPRLAYRYLHKLIGTIWHSRADGVTDSGGQFRFRSFFGDYRVAARIGDRPAVTTMFRHRRGACLPGKLTMMLRSERDR